MDDLELRKCWDSSARCNLGGARLKVGGGGRRQKRQLQKVICIHQSNCFLQHLCESLYCLRYLSSCESTHN